MAAIEPIWLQLEARLKVGFVSLAYIQERWLPDIGAHVLRDCLLAKGAYRGIKGWSLPHCREPYKNW